MATILKRVTDATELAGIHALQTANLGRHLPPEEWTREGFLTSAYTPAFLVELHRHAPAVIAVDDDVVVGYALVATPTARALEPSLAGLFASIDAAVVDGTRLSARAYLVCAAVCVARDYRGLGLLAQLYARMRVDLATRYDCVITDIARENGRSLAAHRRAGFEVCSSLRYDEQTWDLVICDWARTSRP
jgi:GNAT superfamily N-acetyltransferase